jgi:AAA domain-containing protein
MSSLKSGIVSTYSDVDKILRGEPTEYQLLLDAGNTPWGLKALDLECRILETAEKGYRNQELNRAACQLGSLVSSGNLNEDTVRECLIRACHENGLAIEHGKEIGMRSVMATIRSGLTKGKQNPRYPKDDLPEPQAPSHNGSKLTLVLASTIRPEEPEWVWPGVLAKGALSIIGGDPDLGKSTVTLDLAARVSSGGRWPVTKQRASQGTVLIFSAEDNPANTSVPRLMACGADLNRVHFVGMVADAKGEKVFNLKQDIPALEKAIAEIGDVALVIIDPISAYLGNIDSNKNAEVRGALAPLQAVMNKHNVCVLGITHLNKGSGQNAMYRYTGSLGLIAAARTGFLVSVDPNDPDQRIMSSAKNNLSPDKHGFTFKFESVELPNGVGTSRIVWGETTQQITANEVLSDSSEGGKLTEAMDFLRERLKLGWTKAQEVEASARDAGITDITLRRASLTFSQM